jgi:hypothetical protein
MTEERQISQGCNGPNFLPWGKPPFVFFQEDIEVPTRTHCSYFGFQDANIIFGLCFVLYLKLSAGIGFFRLTLIRGRPFSFWGGGVIYYCQGIFFWDRYMQDILFLPITMYDFFSTLFRSIFFFNSLYHLDSLIIVNVECSSFMHCFYNTYCYEV